MSEPLGRFFRLGQWAPGPPSAGPRMKKRSGINCSLAVEFEHAFAMQEHDAPAACHSARFIVEQGRYEYGIGGHIQPVGQLSQTNGPRHRAGGRLFEHKQKAALDGEDSPPRVEIETRADGEQ